MKVNSISLPITKHIPIVDNAINKPAQNNILLFFLKLWIKKLVICLIYIPIIWTGWMINLGSPINRSNPIEPINIKNKFISAN